VARDHRRLHLVRRPGSSDARASRGYGDEMVSRRMRPRARLWQALDLAFQRGSLVYAVATWLHQSPRMRPRVKRREESERDALAPAQRRPVSRSWRSQPGIPLVREQSSRRLCKSGRRRRRAPSSCPYCRERRSSRAQSVSSGAISPGHPSARSPPRGCLACQVLAVADDGASAAAAPVNRPA